MADAAALQRSRFVTFEGGEGVGKSTQAKRLVASLAARSIEAVRTREPGGTARAEAIRSFILKGSSESWGAGAEAVLFAAARLDHVTQLIAPTLAKGKWVVSDRFHDSTRAYQGLTGGVDEKLISALEVLALDGHTPDVTIILDMDPAAAFQRLAERAAEFGVADRFEREDLDWHRRLREAFLLIAENNPERCVVIPAGQPEDALAQEVWDTITRRFPEVAGELEPQS